MALVIITAAKRKSGDIVKRATQPTQGGGLSGWMAQPNTGFLYKRLLFVSHVRPEVNRVIVMY